jgi:hypothetical protein
MYNIKKLGKEIDNIKDEEEEEIICRVLQVKATEDETEKWN